MKKRIVFLISTALCLLGSSAVWADVAIDEAHFPDNRFRDYISRNYDTNDDGILGTQEASTVTDTDLFGEEISSLIGIKYFDNEESLNLGSNNLSTLDMSNCTTLIHLECCNNDNLESIDVSNCTSSVFMECFINNLSSLNAIRSIYYYI